MGPTPLRRVARLSCLQVSTLSSSFGQGLAVFAQGESRAAVDQNSPDVRQIKSSRDEEDVKHGRAGHGFKLEGNIQALTRVSARKQIQQGQLTWSNISGFDRSRLMGLLSA